MKWSTYNNIEYCIEGRTISIKGAFNWYPDLPYGIKLSYTSWVTMHSDYDFVTYNNYLIDITKLCNPYRWIFENQ
jgi:hypothetical protein